MSNEPEGYDPLYAHELLERVSAQWLDFANKAARAMSSWLEENEDAIEGFIQSMYEYELNDPPPEEEEDVFV